MPKVGQGSMWLKNDAQYYNEIRDFGEHLKSCVIGGGAV